MNNWHNTLNEALMAYSLELVALWPLGSNIDYDSEERHIVEDGKNYRLISVTRDNKGRYETAVSYITGRIK